MSTWRRGREVMFERLYRGAPSLRSFLASLSRRPPTRVPGTAVFLTANPDRVPRALLHNLKHNKVLHERVVVLKVETEDVPRVPTSERLEVEHMGANFHRVVVRYGFMEQPDVTAALTVLPARAAGADPHGYLVLPQPRDLPAVGPAGPATLARADLHPHGERRA